MHVIAEHGHLLLILACTIGFFMAWGVGANDVSNAMGTSVGSKALTIKQAILIAMVFEFCGAYFAGGEVTETIRQGIIDPSALDTRPDLLVYGMLASLLAAGVWLMLASIMGWPVSTTHSIVGALVGFGAVGIGVEAVQWGQLSSIAASWIVSPVLAMILAFALFMSVQKLILNTENPFASAKRYIPFYMFAVGFMIAMMTLTKGLKHVGLDLSGTQSFLLSLLAGGAVMGIGTLLLRGIKEDTALVQRNRFANVEKVFAVLMIFTACSMAFAHGANDVANAIGPVAAIIDIVQHGGHMGEKAGIPNWVLLLGAGGIVVGLATYGYKVMATIGKKITELTPSRGFAAEMAAAGTVMFASALGMPISTTHTLVGAVLGVGLARGIGALNLGVVGSIFLSWLVTLPAGASLSILFFFFFKGLFG
jgi:PiT family inorganic phosphate transporter